uniref:GDSL esterase/lipase n=1 Tax=Quercus lobata TaxID=97700 RepID=A0A7N2LT54_QUELO
MLNFLDLKIIFRPLQLQVAKTYSKELIMHPLQLEFAVNLDNKCQALYRLGARKIALFGLGQLGCTPFEMARYGTNGSSCVDIINNAVQIFNNRLKSLVDDLNNSLSGATFIYVNTYSLAAGDASSAGI